MGYGKADTYVLTSEDHMGTLGQMYRALNTKLMHYTAKREAAALPETPSLKNFKDFMKRIATYVGITVVLEALLATWPKDVEQATNDLKQYAQEFESKDFEIPATLVHKMNEALAAH